MSRVILSKPLNGIQIFSKISVAPADKGTVPISQLLNLQAKLRIPKGLNQGDCIAPCTVRSLKDGRLQIVAATAVASGAAVGVEMNDALLLGEVISSAPKPHAWHIEIRVEQILDDLTSLMALRAKLLEENKAAVLPLTTKS
jgi:hypothetical protein